MKNPLLDAAALISNWLPMSIKQRIYRSSALSHLLRMVLNWAAPSGLTITTVAAGGLAGARLELDLQTEKDYWLGTYEPELQRAIADHVRTGMICYDVGANIGYISLLLARQTGPTGKVFAFEALSANLERLKKNTKLNSSGAAVTVIPAAVIDSSRRVCFLMGPSGSMGKVEGSAGRQEYEYKKGIEIDGLSLDDFVYRAGNPPPQIIKIDIEGGEVLALPGMKRLLAAERPVIMIELHGHEAAKAAWERLGELNYSIHRMENGYPKIDFFEDMAWKTYLIAYPGEIYTHID